MTFFFAIKLSLVQYKVKGREGTRVGKVINRSRNWDRGERNGEGEKK